MCASANKRNLEMPKVDGKEYPYTPKGMAMAKNKAKATGKKVTYGKKKKTK